MMNTTKFYAGPSQQWYKGEDSNTSLIYCADGKRTGAVFLADTKQYKTELEGAVIHNHFMLFEHCFNCQNSKEKSGQPVIVSRVCGNHG